MRLRCIYVSNQLWNVLRRDGKEKLEEIAPLGWERGDIRTQIVIKHVCINGCSLHCHWVTGHAAKPADWWEVRLRWLRLWRLWQRLILRWGSKGSMWLLLSDDSLLQAFVRWPGAEAAIGPRKGVGGWFLKFPNSQRVTGVSRGVRQHFFLEDFPLEGLRQEERSKNPFSFWRGSQNSSLLCSPPLCFFGKANVVVLNAVECRRVQMSANPDLPFLGVLIFLGVF